MRTPLASSTPGNAFRTSPASTPPRVLVVFGSLERAGAQLRMLEVCQELRRLCAVKFDLCVLGQGPNELLKEAQLVAESIFIVPVRSARFAFRFTRLLKAGEYDVVSSIPTHLGGLIVWFAAGQGVPTRIVNFRNSLEFPEGGGAAARRFESRPLVGRSLPVRLMRTMVRRNATHVAAVSQGALDAMFPADWRSRQDCRVIYSGIRMTPFEGSADRLGVRKEFGWSPSTRILISVARFSPQKNHRAIIEATKLVYRRDRSIRLLLVGTGRLRDEVGQLIESLGLSGICALAGSRRDVPRLLLASDVFLFPSLWEGLPGAVLEAVAAGLPVVGSDIGPIREIAAFFPKCVLMAPAENVTQHAGHIVRALGMRIDRDLALTTFAQSPFCFQKTIEEYCSLYGVCKSSRG